MTDDPRTAPPADPGLVRGDEPAEHYAAVLDARDRVAMTQPLGDEDALDVLAMRDHVAGLEAELANARAEAEHWRSVAGALRAELGRSFDVRLQRAGRLSVDTARRARAAYRRRVAR